MPQPDLHQASLDLLEFHLVCERLASYTTFPPARELALALTPSHDTHQVARSQEETSEARRFLEQGASLDLSLALDLRSLLQRAALGGILRGAELRQVGDTAKAARLVRASLVRRRDLPHLYSMTMKLPDFRVLEKEMDSAISESGEVLDGASSSLRALRTDVRRAYQHLNDSLQRMLRRLHRQGVLQEPLVTERNGRLVLMAKVDMKHQLPGIVHDVSDSGATVFVEPLSVVTLGNEWRELRLAVEREEERVLLSLSQLVAAAADDLALAVEIIARLDMVMAKARYSLSLNAHPPTVMEGERPYLRLVDIRHPLLMGKVVPISVTMGDLHPVLLITGPNAGGKTVALKTVGLSVLMAQAGLHLPATEAAFTLFDGVYADIGDQQSIQRSLSTFSSHIQTLRDIIQQATCTSLVLLDELGTSTDPEEGAALAKAVLARFAERGTMLIATSHYRDVAAFVQEASNMLNASVELDPQTLEPTYHLTPGLPGRSYALAIAARHGLDEAMLQSARSSLAPAQQGTERLLRELQEERHLAEELRREAEEARAEARQRSNQLEEQMAAIEDQKAEMLEEARSQLREKTETLLKLLQRAERALAETGQPAFVAEAPTPSPQPEDARSTVPEVLEEVAQVRRELRSPRWQPSPGRRRDWLRRLRSGDWVYLRGISQPVEVLTPSVDENTLEVMLGSMRARLPLYQVVRPAPEQEVTARQGVFLAKSAQREVKTQLDLRGQRVEDALEQVDALLNDAASQGVSTLRIVHGVGTGALRAAIREHLSRHSLVSSFHPDEATAADGATVVGLA